VNYGDYFCRTLWSSSRWNTKNDKYPLSTSALRKGSESSDCKATSRVRNCSQLPNLEAYKSSIKDYRPRLNWEEGLDALLQLNIVISHSFNLTPRLSLALIPRLLYFAMIMDFLKSPTLFSRVRCLTTLYNRAG